ncbi:MAG: GreA/GreB family elongation factor [Oscillospiraceae bacterium]|nr:GreA/GreB family elongation factor [Oscillospiraceae bacterium]
MHDQLTKEDIKKMQEEIDYRNRVLRPKIMEDVVTARSYGDLSENFEYKAAKQEQRKNDSRTRYLERMIKTAVVISDESDEDTAGLYDLVELYFEEDDELQQIRLVTTLRQDSTKWLISNVSPLGKAVMGRKAGDRVSVKVNEEYSYFVQIRSVTKGEDDGSIDILPY